jgi:hypothetical protein
MAQNAYLSISTLPARWAPKGENEMENRIQGMLRSIFQYRNMKPKIIIEECSKAHILFLLEEARHDIIVLWEKVQELQGETK